jgi:hypothetical protein
MVQFNTPVEEEDVWGMVEGRSIKGLSFSVESVAGSGDYTSLPIGTKYTMATTESLQKRQATDFGSNDLKFYDDGKPIFDLIATGMTEYRDATNSDDDGTRRLFFTSSMRRALQDEMKAKKLKRFGIGTQITVELTGFKPNPKGKPTKLFNVTINPTEWVPMDQLATEQALNEEQFPAAVSPAVIKGQPGELVPAPPKKGLDFAALMAQAAATTAANAAAEAPKVVVTAEELGQARLLIAANVDRATAIDAVADNAHPGDAGYRTALDEALEF